MRRFLAFLPALLACLGGLPAPVGHAAGSPAAKRLLLSPVSWTPARLTPALWLDASDRSTLYQDSALTTPVAADGDPVGGLKDKSGFGRHATQATAAARPLYKTGVQNGRGVLRLDGVDDYLESSYTLGTNCTIFLVGKANGDVQALLSQVASGTVILLQRDGAWFDTGVAQMAVSMYSGVFGMGSYVFDYTNDAYSVYDNGALEASSALAASNVASPVLIGSWQRTQRFLNGDIAEVLIYPRILSTSDRQRVEGYLRRKWGTP